ncbi:MAG TPA: PLP-dependent aminotransferase family protein [Nitrospirota bacterium]|nr:PLP-dependent aminotransferase family protein [Nitrospirota bacterium]
MFSERMNNVKSSAIRDILKIISKPGMISLAGGLPAPELFPVDAVKKAAERVLTKFGAEALQYSFTEGIPALREKIAEQLNRSAGGLTIDNVLITQGSQQGLDLIAKVFINKGSLVMTENPSYLGALQAFQLFEAAIEPIPSDSHGILVPVLRERLKKHKPVFLYIMPNFQNPTGIAYPLDRRRELVAAAREHDVLIVEDDPYGELIFEGERLPTLFSLAGGRNVVRMTTFSKTIAPGLRIASVAADQELIKKLVIAKQATDLHTNSFGQYLVLEYLESGGYEEHIARIRQTYRERRDVMLAAMEQWFPESVTWNKPAGGMFFWVMLPASWDAAEILLKCIEHNVAFVPGREFFPDGSGKNTLRLNFSNAAPQYIEEGIRRMGEVFKTLS